jgi:hypothetical protein
VKIPGRDITVLESTGILTRHAFRGEWNYTLRPRAPDTPGSD